MGAGVPALDGVRALAVAAVLADHGGLAGTGGGFVGVDVFFVLSGFLITSLLLAEHRRTGRIDLAGFWTRRARRLLPALVIVVLAVGLFRDLFPPDAVAGLRADALSALGWVANWRFETQRTDYFSQGGTPSPLQHTWSLGVEEQYYLLWPLLLVALAGLTAVSVRHRRAQGACAPDIWRLAVGRLAVCGAVASAVEAVVLASHGALSRVYFGTDTRSQALLIGAAAAAMLAPYWPSHDAAQKPLASPRARLICKLLPVGGLAALAAAVHWASGSPAEFRLGLLTGVALAAGMLITGVSLEPTGIVARVLATRPMVGLGMVSYGIYLWHWPVFLAVDGARTGMSGIPLFAVRCLATLALAVISWVLVERPLRRWRPVPGRVLPTVAWAVAVAAAVIVVAVPVGLDPGAGAGDLPPDLPAQMAASASTPSVVARSHSLPLLGPGAPALSRSSNGPAGTAHVPVVSTVTDPSKTTSAATAARTPRSVPLSSAPAPKKTRDPNRPLTVDVFGDSIAWTLMRYLPDTPGVTFIDHTALGCGVVRGGPYRYFGDVSDQRPQCDAWPRTWSAQVAADRPDEALLLVGRWETMDRLQSGQWKHLGDPTFDGNLADELGRAITVLGATGARVVISTEPYNRRGEKPDGSLYPEDEPQRVDRWNAIVRAVLSDRPAVKLLDLNKQLCPGGAYTPDVDGIRVRSDGVHLTPAGVAWLTPWLVSALRTDFR